MKTRNHRVRIRQYACFCNLCVFLSFFFLASCATGTFNITSTPEGAYIKTINKNGTEKKIGQTPFKIEGQDLLSKDVDYLQLVVEKEDYVRESAIIPREFINYNNTLQFMLQKANTAEKGEHLTEGKYRDLAQGVAEVQSLLTKKEWKNAENRLNVLITQFPFISVLYDLIGNSYYMQHNFDSALKSYEKSLTIFPENKETVKMVAKLRRVTGNKSSKSSGEEE